MPRIATPAQIEAARRNGARSRGPKTAAGKARSARNATTHGLTSRRLQIPPVPDPFLQDFLDDFQPADATELAYIRQLALTRWTQIWCLEQELALEGDRPPFEAFQQNRAGFFALWNIASRASRRHSHYRSQLLAYRAAAQEIFHYNEPGGENKNHYNEPGVARTAEV